MLTSSDPTRLYDRSKLVERYIGWELPQDKPAVVFSVTFGIAVNYFFALDAALMFMSKGGFGINDCLKIGVRTKDAYVKEFQTIFKSFYGGGSKKEGEKEIDGGDGMPEGFNVNG